MDVCLEPEYQDDGEPMPDLAFCNQCGWRGPISDLIDIEDVEYCPVGCPKCKSCIDGDSYDTSLEQGKKWILWWEKKYGPQK